MKKRHKRLAAIVIGFSGLAIAVTLILQVFNSNINVFYSPSEVQANMAPQGRTFRLGGLVEEGSIKHSEDTLLVHFDVTDKAHKITVAFDKLLPDLFREGQGVIAQGKLNDKGVFVADEVLAKHDESYIAPEVQDALDKAEAQKTAATEPDAVIPEKK